MTPMIRSLNLLNRFPWSGLVIKYPVIPFVGHYSTLTLSCLYDLWQRRIVCLCDWFSCYLRPYRYSQAVCALFFLLYNVLSDSVVLSFYEIPCRTHFWHAVIYSENIFFSRDLGVNLLICGGHNWEASYHENSSTNMYYHVSMDFEWFIYPKL